ncbi:MAG: hypothetical protein AAF542_08260 [Pseudomonadota bacterium]
MKIPLGCFSIKCLCPMVMALAITASCSLRADNHPAPTFSPTEIFMCSYRKGKDADDLAKATEQWNEWMDEQNDHGYLALTLTPYLNDPAVDFDTFWVGSWKDGAAMAKALDRQGTGDGPEVIGEFFEVVDCPTHAVFAVGTVKKPSRQSAPETAIMSFSDCSIAEDKSTGDAASALAAWGEYLTSEGLSGPIWMWWPAYGGPKGDFDFKLVEGYATNAEFGAAFDQYGNGGGFMKAAELLDGTISCDVPRAYNMALQRSIKAPE